MSRHGYTEDCDNEWESICWRGAVASALRGERGQMFLRALVTSLDALPKPELIARELVTGEGCCALGAVALHCGIDVADLNPEEPTVVAARFGIARALAAEVAYENDEAWRPETPAERWTRMRMWALRNILPGPTSLAEEPPK